MNTYYAMKNEDIACFVITLRRDEIENNFDKLAI